MFCSALVFSGCGKKDSLAKIIKNYPKKVVENFYKNGIVKTEKYDESVSGKSVYEQISEKNPDGTVNPKPLKKLKY
ncbi:hypothetical protein [Treponema sp.]|uniref:hypothetical protein n=1 Tax=Treponema sp. TaxID=166 RepID=UPI00298EC855|nr:hypothetical protein [Treponema sp.]